MSSISIGIGLLADPFFNRNLLSVLARQNMFTVNDVHFSHNDNELIKSGRFFERVDESVMQHFMNDALNLNLNPTLLLNYISDKTRFDEVVDIVETQYISKGITNFVVADMELVRKLRSKFGAAIHITSSTLNYALTAEDLQIERDAGVDLHNPSVDIIRDEHNLVRNQKMGFKQKIIFGEGCIHNCPHELAHRNAIANDREFKPNDLCDYTTMRDFRLVLKANWVTGWRLRELLPSIDVIKLPRGTFKLTNVDDFIDDLVKFKLFLEDDDVFVNPIDYTCVSYSHILKDKNRSKTAIPDFMIPDEFYKISDGCGYRCDELDCNMCHNILKKLKRGGYIDERYQITDIFNER